LEAFPKDWDRLIRPADDEKRTPPEQVLVGTENQPLGQEVNTTKPAPKGTSESKVGETASETTPKNAVPRWNTKEGQKLLSANDSDLGRLALKERVDKGIPATRNVFVVEYEANGVKQTKVFVSQDGVHSEIVAMKELPKDAKVLRAYSERTPCTSGANQCYLQMLNDPRFASMQELQYSYVWGTNEAKTQEAILKAMQQFGK
jgi:hypothetical protein